MSVWNTPATERVAALREQAGLYGDPTADLSDLELLNARYESVLREQIDTRDRYMGLLTSLRKHDDAVRTTAVSAFKEHADRYAQNAVRQHMQPFNELLHRVEQLPDRPGPKQTEALRSSAAQVRSALKESGSTEDIVDPDGARHTLRTLRHVVAMLEVRDGLRVEEVLGLVRNALHDDSLIDLFTVADRATLAPPAPSHEPPFAGPGWSDLRGFWAYQPENAAAHVKAYPVGEDWYLDLWSARGQLLAFGSVPADEVTLLAPALVDQADSWVRDRSEYAWRRFADTAKSTRDADQREHARGEPAARREAADSARVRVATAVSSQRPAGPLAGSPHNTVVPTAPPQTLRRSR
ncbi:hypothetical protein ACWEFL_20615 [Streptomyces sp. NPDC004838]